MPDWLRHPLKDPFYKDWDVCPYCGLGVRRRVTSEDGTVEEYSYRYCPWCGEKICSEKETNE